MWSVHACAEFEKRGIPATVIVTDVFAVRAHQLLKSLGFPDIPVLVTANPVVYLRRTEIEKRVEALLGSVMKSFTATAQ